MNEAIDTIVCNNFLDILLLYQTSARDVELLVARNFVSPPIVSPSAAGVETATAIDNEPSDLIDPVARAKVGCCDDSLHKSLLGVFGSIRVVILVYCTSLVAARQLSVEHLEHRLGLGVRLVVGHDSSQDTKQRHDDRTLAPNESQQVLLAVRRMLQFLPLDQFQLLKTICGVVLLRDAIGHTKQSISVDQISSFLVSQEKA